MNDWLPHKKPALLNSDLRNQGIFSHWDWQQYTQTYRRNTCIIIKSIKIISLSLLLRSAGDINSQNRHQLPSQTRASSLIIFISHMTFSRKGKDRDREQASFFFKKCFYLWFIMRKRWIQLCFPSSLSGNWSKCDFWRPKLHKGLFKVVPECFCFYNCTDFISF